MSTTTDPARFRTGTKVRLPARYGADGKLHPAVDTEVSHDAWKNISGIWVCRVAHWPGTTVRVDKLELIEE